MDSSYILVTDYVNITFINTIYRHHLIFQQGLAVNNYLGIFPYCLFQYMISTSNKYNVSEFIKLYSITTYLRKMSTTIVMVLK